MSRVGRKPIKIPQGVKVAVLDQVVTVVGPKGQLKNKVSADLAVKVREDVLSIFPKKNESEVSNLWGLSRTLIQNMILGVTSGFQKELSMVGMGFRAQVEGNKKLTLSVGFSHPVVIEAPEGIAFTVADKTSMRVEGIDKALVGEVAARIRAVKPPEPYQGKGIRYVGEHIRRKAGKAAKVGTGFGG